MPSDSGHFVSLLPFIFMNHRLSPVIGMVGEEAVEWRGRGKCLKTSFYLPAWGQTSHIAKWLPVTLFGKPCSKRSMLRRLNYEGFLSWVLRNGSPRKALKVSSPPPPPLSPSASWETSLDEGVVSEPEVVCFEGQPSFPSNWIIIYEPPLYGNSGAPTDFINLLKHVLPPLSGARKEMKWEFYVLISWGYLLEMVAIEYF